jgi:hypothetical protein
MTGDSRTCSEDMVELLNRQPVMMMKERQKKGRVRYVRQYH